MYKPTALAQGVELIRKKHFHLIDQWHKKRKAKMPDPSNYSDLGFLVDGRVAGWLYITNSNIAMIEGIISDPDTVPSLRRQSVKKLMAILIETADHLGFKNVIGITEHPKMMETAQLFGFREAKGFKIMCLPLHNDEDEKNAGGT